MTDISIVVHVGCIGACVVGTVVGCIVRAGVGGFVGAAVGCFVVGAGLCNCVGAGVWLFGDVGSFTVESPANGIENEVVSEALNSPPLAIVSPPLVLNV